MLEDKFKLTRANIILIVINVILVLFVIAAAVELIISLKDSSGEIPELKTTAGKSSTLVADGTSTTTTESTTTTTKKQGHDNSPYYDINPYEILNKELLEKTTLTMEETQELGEEYFKIYEGLILTGDDDFVNINHLLSKVKSGEKDKITKDGHDYGIIYNGKSVLESIFTNEAINSIRAISFNGVKPIYYNMTNYEYYKMGGNQQRTYEIVRFDYRTTGSENERRIKITYKDLNDKSGTYKSGYVSIKYINEEKKWKSNGIDFPNKDV
jgi:hypothetical protein